MKQKTKKIIISSIFLVFGLLISVKSASASAFNEAPHIKIFEAVYTGTGIWTTTNNTLQQECIPQGSNYLICVPSDLVPEVKTYEAGIFNQYTFPSLTFLGGFNNPLEVLEIGQAPAPVINTSGIFFPVDQVTGKTQAGDLMASAGTATSTTVESLTPVVVVVLGILLAFIAIKAVIGLIKDTKKDTKIATKDVKYTKKI